MLELNELTGENYTLFLTYLITLEKANVVYILELKGKIFCQFFVSLCVKLV